MGVRQRAGRQRQRRAALGFLAPGPAGRAALRRRRRRATSSSTRPARGARPGGAERVRDFARDERHPRHQARSRRGAHPVRRRATSGPTGATVARCATTTPSCRPQVHHDAHGRGVPRRRLRWSSPAAPTPGRSAGPILWGGDIPGSESFGSGPGTDLGLRSAIISQQRAAFLGYPIWGSDTGGYYQFKDREVFARWIEFSAFSGIMEIGGVGTHAPWDMPTEPRLRRGDDRHLPALHAAARAPAALPRRRGARGRGHAECRSCDRWCSPTRTTRSVGDLWDEYLFGPDLLVAPLWRVGAARARGLLARRHLAQLLGRGAALRRAARA